MRCLVTGGCGFIGSNLALALEERGHDVTVLDTLDTGDPQNLAGFGGRVMIGDAGDANAVDGPHHVVFHHAAITDPRYPDDDELLRRNLSGFAAVLAACLRTGAKLVYASSASVYGNAPAPQREDQPKDLLSAYARSKLIVDEMASHHWRDHHVVGLRYNQGREASSYLWYICENYHTLDGDYLFCQGHPFDHDGDFLVNKDHERYFGGWHDCDEFGHPHTFAALPMNSTLEKLGLPRYERFRFRAGAQFRLSTEEIRLYPRTFYERAYEISMTEELAPWTFERLWPYIFPDLAAPS